MKITVFDENRWPVGEVWWEGRVWSAYGYDAQGELRWLEDFVTQHWAERAVHEHVRRNPGMVFRNQVSID
jgi:hypothetical protein